MLGLSGLAVVGADAVLAAQAEHRISEAVATRSNLAMNPQVSFGGVLYSLGFLTGEIPSLTISALDVDVPGFGLVNARTAIDTIEASPGQVLAGNVAGTRAELYSRRLTLDGVAVGRILGITDLDISNPYDISPSGGTAVEARLTGTPPGLDGKVTVLATLRISGPFFRMTPVDLLDAPAGLDAEARAAALEAFAWELDTRDLPLEGMARAAYVTGGSIAIESERRAITVRLEDLSPLESTERSDFDASGFDGGSLG